MRKTAFFGLLLALLPWSASATPDTDDNIGPTQRGVSTEQIDSILNSGLLTQFAYAPFNRVEGAVQKTGLDTRSTVESRR